MRTSLFLGCGAVSIAMVLGCGDSSGTGGSGGAGTTTTTSTSAKTSTTSSKASTTGTTASGTGGAGGDMGVQCNPVKDGECDVAGGEGCDYDINGNGFVCYLGPNLTLDTCAACDYGGGNPPFCKDGLTCMPDDAAMMTGKCAKFCCSDADCDGTAGSCNKTLSADPNVGLCGAPDATSMFFTPICTGLPATPPSNGTCYTVP